MQLDHLYFEGIIPDRSRSLPVKRTPEVIRPVGAVRGKEDGFIGSLFGISDLSVSAYRTRALTRRLPACLRFLRVSDVQEASLKIWKDPELAVAALNIVLLGVTEFFRDQAVFDHLQQNVLPRLLERNARPRIWSAACSDGQELYSVGMLLEEMGRLADCELVGTDLRSEAVNQASSGIFARSSLDQLDQSRRQRFFTEGGNSALIDPVLRAQTKWAVADLLRDVEKGPWDVILWRNMAIYLEYDAAGRVWEDLCAELRPGGYLIGGRADVPPKWLPLKRVGPCTYQRTGARMFR